MSGLTLKKKVHFRSGRRSKKELQPGEAPPKSPRGRIPRIARLMALAIRFDDLLQGGHVADQAELARLGHVSRARITQIMNLLNLAPDLQEKLLFLHPVESGRDPLFERQLRTVVAEIDWERQRRLWETRKKKAAPLR